LEERFFKTKRLETPHTRKSVSIADMEGEEGEMGKKNIFAALHGGEDRAQTGGRRGKTVTARCFELYRIHLILRTSDGGK